MSVPLEGAVSCGTVGSASFGPAAPVASTRTPSFEPSAILWPARVSAAPWPLKMRRPVAPPSATWMLPAVSRSAVVRTVGVEIVVLPGTLRAAVWKLASPDWMESATRCWRETGFCELSSIVIRLSGRTLNTVPSAKWISAAAPGARAHEVVLAQHDGQRRRQPLERPRPLHLDAAVDLLEAGAGLDRGGRRRGRGRAAEEDEPAERREQEDRAPGEGEGPVAHREPLDPITAPARRLLFVGRHRG